LAKNECHHQAKEGCHNFCYPGSNSYRCSCADGYELGKDDKQCIALGRCQHGRTGSTCSVQEGVLLLNSEGKGFCGGVLLKSNYVLTTGECALLYRHFEIRVGTGDNCLLNGTSGTKKTMQVGEKHIHIQYDEDTGENNIALLQLCCSKKEHVDCSNHQLPICTPERDFAERIWLPKSAGTVSGWRIEGNELQGDELQVSFLPAEDCKQILNISLTNRQFCGHLQEAVDSFLMTEYKGTWFLIGILGSWPLEDADWETLLFTNTARYMIWFKQKRK
ncbi:PROZ protein, partial [Galbula dea]|nr:PROZ protein [Galbula dea]